MEVYLYYWPLENHVAAAKSFIERGLGVLSPFRTTNGLSDRGTEKDNVSVKLLTLICLSLSAVGL